MERQREFVKSKKKNTIFHYSRRKATIGLVSCVVGAAVLFSPIKFKNMSLGGVAYSETGSLDTKYLNSKVSINPNTNTISLIFDGFKSNSKDIYHQKSIKLIITNEKGQEIKNLEMNYAQSNKTIREVVLDKSDLNSGFKFKFEIKDTTVNHNIPFYLSTKDGLLTDKLFNSPLVKTKSFEEERIEDKSQKDKERNELLIAIKELQYEIEDTKKEAWATYDIVVKAHNDAFRANKHENPQASEEINKAKQIVEKISEKASDIEYLILKVSKAQSIPELEGYKTESIIAINEITELEKQVFKAVNKAIEFIKAKEKLEAGKWSQDGDKLNLKALDKDVMNSISEEVKGEEKPEAGKWSQDGDKLNLKALDKDVMNSISEEVKGKEKPEAGKWSQDGDKLNLKALDKDVMNSIAEEVKGKEKPEAGKWSQDGDKLNLKALDKDVMNSIAEEVKGKEKPEVGKWSQDGDKLNLKALDKDVMNDISKGLKNDSGTESQTNPQNRPETKPETNPQSKPESKPQIDKNGNLNIKEEFVLTFKVEDGTIYGKKSYTIKAKKGDIIIIPEGAKRDGYEFDYWEGSVYYPGDKYEVVGNHTFVAKWKVKENNDNKSKNTDKGKVSPKVDNTTAKKTQVKTSEKKAPLTADNGIITSLSTLVFAGAAFLLSKKRS